MLECVLGAEVAEYDVNILEMAAGNTTVEEIHERESLWKIKLGTRAIGLNGIERMASGQRDNVNASEDAVAGSPRLG